MGSSHQFRQFWAALGLNQKVTIVLSVFGVVALMVGMLVWASQPRMALLFSRLDDKDMGEVVELIKGQNIPYKIEGNSIFVPTDQVSALRMEAHSKGAISGGSVGYEIFDQGNFGVSDFVQRTNKTRALQGELERAIGTIDGVRKAQVLIYQKENKLVLKEFNDEPKASVTIDTGGRVLANEQVIGIRNLVAYAIGGLSPENVSVVDNRGHSLSDRVSENGQLAAANSQMKLRQEMEAYFRNKIEDMLGRVVGPENVTAQVSVSVDTESTLQEREIFDPEGRVVRMEEIEKEKSETNEIQQDPIVGETPNTPVGLGGAVTGEPSRSDTSSKRDHKKASYEISRVRTTTERQPGAIRAITATVILNKLPLAEGVEGEGGRSEQELLAIKEMVANALGVDSRYDTPETDTITVAEAVFTGLSDADVGPDLRDEIRHWFETLKGPLVVLIAVVMFFIFLRMVKRHKPALTPIEVLTDDEEDSLVKGNVGPRPTPELLNELIQEKPENVARALKSWSAIK